MTTKNATRKQRIDEPVTPPERDMMRRAYEAHTLAQMLYGQMVMAHGWPVPMYPGAGFHPAQGMPAYSIAGFQPAGPIPAHSFAAFQPAQGHAAQPFAAFPHVQPLGGLGMGPDLPGRTGMWGAHPAPQCMTWFWRP